MLTDLVFAGIYQGLAPGVLLTNVVGLMLHLELNGLSRAVISMVKIFDSIVHTREDRGVAFLGKA